MTRPIIALTLLFTATTLHPLPLPPANRVVYEAPKELTQVIHALLVASRRYGVDPMLAFSVAWNESRLRPWEQSRDPKTHEVIARGLMQISKRYQDDHVRKYLPGLHPSNFDWRNPMHSALLGCAMLADYVNRYGVWGALAIYNSGEGRYKELWHGRPLPNETVKYQRRVLAGQ